MWLARKKSTVSWLALLKVMYESSPRKQRLEIQPPVGDRPQKWIESNKERQESRIVSLHCYIFLCTMYLVTFSSYPAFKQSSSYSHQLITGSSYLATMLMTHLHCPRPSYYHEWYVDFSAWPQCWLTCVYKPYCLCRCQQWLLSFSGILLVKIL